MKHGTLSLLHHVSLLLIMKCPCCITWARNTFAMTHPAPCPCCITWGRYLATVQHISVTNNGRSVVLAALPPPLRSLPVRWRWTSCFILPINTCVRALTYSTLIFTSWDIPRLLTSCILFTTLTYYTSGISSYSDLHDLGHPTPPHIQCVKGRHASSG